MIGYLLGFIWGIQYSHDAPTECFTNIEFTLLQLDTVFAELYYVLMPDQWGSSVVSFQNLIDLLSSLYGNCQIQQFLAMAPTFVTYEGLTALVTRTLAGLQAEIPLFYTKMTEASDRCVRGEAAGKMT